MTWTSVFVPNQSTDKSMMSIYTLGTVGVLLLFWLMNPSPLIPKPLEVLGAFVQLWTAEGLGIELMTSFKLSIFSLATSTFFVLLLAYSTRWNFMIPFVNFITKLRFLGLVGLVFVFTRATNSGFQLKMALMCFTIIAFFLTSMVDVVKSIPNSRYEYGRTLRMNEFHILWEVVVLGTLDAAFKVLRQNAAIGWMMLTMVEGISRAEGGIGALMLNQNKHFHLEAVFAIQISVLLIGLLQDYLIGLTNRIVCPYASMAQGNHK